MQPIQPPSLGRRSVPILNHYMCLKVQTLPSRRARIANQVHYRPTTGQSDVSDYCVCSNVAGTKESYSKVDEISKCSKPWPERDCQLIQQRDAVIMSEFMFKFLVSCHTLTLVIYVLCIILVRSGCDEGGYVWFLSWLGVLLYLWGVCMFSYL